MALRRRLPSLALTAASVGALAWLVVAQHDQLGRAIAGIGHARARLIVAAIFCERVSMFSLARMQRRLLPDRGQHLTLLSVIGITFAGNALSLSVPVAGAGLGAAFSFREFERHQVSRPAAGFALAVSGVLSTLSLMVIVAGGALASGNAVAGTFGLLGAAAVAAGIAVAVLGLRVPACRRLVE